jgi:hypothetical protein
MNPLKKQMSRRSNYLAQLASSAGGVGGVQVLLLLEISPPLSLKWATFLG